ncbi:hypothetical protein [Lactobacillus porci]|uniref:hypothetical protein n=1 Tax=Lactobacillus porci TaxID=2012477 RepID=UPI0039929EDC
MSKNNDKTTSAGFHFSHERSLADFHLPVWAISALDMLTASGRPKPQMLSLSEDEISNCLMSSELASGMLFLLRNHMLGHRSRFAVKAAFGFLSGEPSALKQPLTQLLSHR